MSTFLPLTINNRRLMYNPELIKPEMEELEKFLDGESYLKSKNFAEEVLFSQEIKSNNTVEGYNDDVGLVYDVVYNSASINDKEKMKRIKNLYLGYKYAFEGKEITEDNLIALYKILSDGLLPQNYLENMDKYRKAPVYIYGSKRLDVYDEGVDSSEIQKYMDEYFSFIQSNNSFKTDTEYFIKSQIMHFQFVSIHPFFDVNGRTSRTVSIWYLLNNEVYPYIIFNRGISLDDNIYCKVIKDAKVFGNITYFLNYMLGSVRLELEKEYIMDMIKYSSNQKLTAVDFQTMYYILSMKGFLSAKDFFSFYNRHNDKKKSLEIYRTMLEPLLDKNIIIKVRDTKGDMKDEKKNFVFKLNPSMYDVDPDKIKKLKI